jgi:hypothetical protein
MISRTEVPSIPFWENSRSAAWRSATRVASWEAGEIVLRSAEVIRMHETNNSQSVFSLRALLRFDDNLLRHEHGALRGSTCLRGGDTEFGLALIELIDDLAHGCLIQID